MKHRTDDAREPACPDCGSTWALPANPTLGGDPVNLCGGCHRVSLVTDWIVRSAAGVQPQRREGGGVNRRDLQLLAEGWDKCVKSLRYEDGSPVEIVSNSNPYRKELEGLDTKEAEQ